MVIRVRIECIFNMLPFQRTERNGNVPKGTKSGDKTAALDTVVKARFFRVEGDSRYGKIYDCPELSDAAGS